MDSTYIFVIIIVLIIYTSYWTYYNDYGLFLFIILILVSIFFISQYINEKMFYYEKKIKDIIYEQIHKLNNIIIRSEKLNLKNIKSNIFD